MELLNDMLSGLILLAVGIVEALAVRDRAHYKSVKHQADQHAAEWAEYDELRGKLHMASVEMLFATAEAVERGHSNGELTNARAKVQAAHDAYLIYTQKIAARRINNK